MKTLITGHYRDAHNRTYNLTLEPAVDLGNGRYLIQREFTIEVWRVYN